MVPYSYGSIETLLIAGEEVRRIERTFNKFHLLTEENTVKNEARKIIKTTYHEKPDTPFISQPLNFQLPYQVETRWLKEGLRARSLYVLNMIFMAI